MLGFIADAGWDHMGPWGWSMMVFWWILIVALLGALVWAALNAGRQAGRPSRRTAEEILAERYARGEIDREEFERRLEDLRNL